ncbi:MAG: hypothetical protein AAGC73_06510 [Verrucomicrobiota bacterium]
MKGQPLPVLMAVESTEVRSESALKQVEADGADYEEMLALEKNVQFIIAQKLAKGRPR